MQGRAHNSEHRTYQQLESPILPVRRSAKLMFDFSILIEMELITQLAGKFAEEQGAFKLLVR